MSINDMWKKACEIALLQHGGTWRGVDPQTTFILDAIQCFKGMLHAENIDWREGQVELRGESVSDLWLVDWTFIVSKSRPGAAFSSLELIPFDALTVVETK